MNPLTPKLVTFFSQLLFLVFLTDIFFSFSFSLFSFSKIFFFYLDKLGFLIFKEKSLAIFLDLGIFMSFSLGFRGIFP